MSPKALEALKVAAARAGLRAGAALVDSLAADGQGVLGMFAREIGVGRSWLRSVIPDPESETVEPKPKKAKVKVIDVEPE